MIKIHRLEIENVKRVKAVKIEPAENGLTVIGGKNGQGKTSVLDAIAWALGGNRFRPEQAQRDGSALPPSIHIVLSHGLVVERKGKNSDLKVIDPKGRKSGQQLLDSFVDQLALDLPRFMQASDAEKAQTLLNIIGVGDTLAALERQEAEAYNRRRAIGQIADQKIKFAKEMQYYPDAPKDLLSASDLIAQQQDILAKNGENQRKRQSLTNLKIDLDYVLHEIGALTAKLHDLEARRDAITADIAIASASVEELRDIATDRLEAGIRDVDRINVMVRANMDKIRAEEDAKTYKDQYDTLTGQLEELRRRKTDLLSGADLPLPGLTVEDGALLYNGFKWECMSGSDQLRVATAIVRRLNPECGFVLMDKLEQMDADTLRDFGAWLEAEGLQVIATRVGTGGECSIIISDGYVDGAAPEATEEDAARTSLQEMTAPAAQSWTEGVF